MTNGNPPDLSYSEPDLRIDLDFTDQGEAWTMWIKNGVLHARRARSSAAQLTISGPKAAAFIS